MAKIAPLSKNLASMIEAKSTTAACQIPAPAQVRISSPIKMPRVQPIATSNTRRNLGSRENPRAMSEEVAAKIGPLCPSTNSAKA